MHLKRVKAYDAKTHFSSLLEEVRHGEKVIITRNGEPIAILSPYREEKPSVSNAINALKEFRDKHKLKLKGLSIREMRDEGRRF